MRQSLSKTQTLNLQRPNSTGSVDMFPDLQVGSLNKPLTGRRRDQRTIAQQYYKRVAYYQKHGLISSDRVFVHHENTIESFVDLRKLLRKNS